MLGADSRSNVGRIGPSSNSLVRAAPGCCADLTGAEVAEAIIGGSNDGEIAALRSFTRRSLPRRGLEQLLDDASWKAGRLRWSPTLTELFISPAQGKASFLGLA